MSQQRLVGSPEKTRQHVESRKTRPTSAQSFPGELHPILQLQRIVGNRAVGRLMHAKLAVSHPGDSYEREAERVAEQLTSMPSPASTPTAQRQMMPEAAKDTQPLQTKPLAVSMTPLAQRQAMPEEQRARTPEQEGAAIAGAPAGWAKGPVNFLSTSAHDAARASAEPSAPEALAARPAGGGQPLPDSVRSYFEPRFGRSFAHVRAHTAAESADMADAFGARAYTVGRDIVFGAGAYAPETHAGRQLLAHELTHVLQSSPRGDVVFRIPLDPAGTPFLAEVFPAWSTPLREQPSHDGRRLADLPRAHVVTVEGGRGWIRVSTSFEGKELVGFISHEQLRRRADQTPDPGSGRLAKLSADYEAAVKALDWVTAAEVLDAMNDADIQARLKKLHGTDQAEMRRGAVNSKNLRGGPRLTAAIDAINLDAQRLAQIIDAYEAARQRGDWVQAGISLHSLNDADIRARLNRLSRSELAAMRRDAPDRLANLIDAALAPKSRTITPAENDILARLARLGIAAKAEGTEGAAFAAALDDFRKTLRFRMNDLSPGTLLPADVDLVMKALMLWSADPGNKWGEGSWDSTDLVMSAPDYVTVPASQYKCNAYVAEVIYQSLGFVYRIHEATQAKGKYFPYQAKEWGDPAMTIPNFMQTTTPRMGDVWSNGSHTGIFLGEYSGKKLYISARDDGSGVFGLKAQVQKEHGVQIKFLPDGGVYRRYTP